MFALVREMKNILSGKPGARELLMGNEGIARGAIEAGVQVATGYPGTPSSEILETLASVADELGIYTEWSVNEKVAVEVASSASILGLRALTAMKHVGMNVASDIMLCLNISGVNGGYVVVSADDPAAWVSQNEQDNRHYGCLLNVPMYEPSNPQEAKDMTWEAFEISEKLQLPVMVRTTTRVNLASGDVVLGEISRQRRQPAFLKDFNRYYCGDVIAVARHRWLHEQIQKMRAISENSSFNSLQLEECKKIGVAASGGSYNYAIDALRVLGLEGVTSILKIGIVHPLPESLIRKMCKNVEKVLIVEEVEPIVENKIKQTLTGMDHDCEVRGRETGDIPWSGELNVEIVASAIARLTGVRYEPRTPEFDLEAGRLLKAAPPRFLSFCAGCPHIGTFYSLKCILKKMSLKDYAILGDIGCYGLAFFPPFEIMDTTFCMSASLGQACGFIKAGYKGLTIATIGDGTFFHSGLAPLINSVYNNANIKVIICDNETIAMTGHQPHPGLGITISGKLTKPIRIENLVKACGIDFIEVTDSYDLLATKEAIEKALTYEGPAVVIARRACPEILRRDGRGAVETYQVDPEKCTKCGVCVSSLGCPAISLENDIAKIDENICVGCSMCAQVCRLKAIDLQK